MGYMIRFEGSPYANHLYTRRGSDPQTLDEAIICAEDQWPFQPFELWGPDGDYCSPAFDTED